MEKTLMPPERQMLTKALGLMEAALELLDAASCSAEVGAHLDLAIWRLRDIVPEYSAAADGATVEQPTRAVK